MQSFPLCKIVACLAAAFILLIAGCEDKPASPPASSPQEKPLVGVFIYRKDDVYISTVASAIEAGLAGKAEVSMHYAGEDQLTQNEQLETLLQKKAAAVALNLADIQAAAHTVDRIKKAGIPVVYFNREPDMATIKTYDKARFVGTTIMDAGKMQGELIAHLWETHPGYDRNGDGRCQYVMFQGNADNPEALARTECSVRLARENGVEMRQLGQSFICNWDRELAARSMEFALAQYPDAIEFVVSNNDSMALGAIDALQKHGYNLEGKPEKFIPVVGVDAIPEAIVAIRKGIMSATVKQDGAAMGKTIATLLLNSLEGKDFLEGIPYSWDESGIAVRIPYAPFEKGSSNFPGRTHSPLPNAAYGFIGTLCLTHPQSCAFRRARKGIPPAAPRGQGQCSRNAIPSGNEHLAVFLWRTAERALTGGFPMKRTFSLPFQYKAILAFLLLMNLSFFITGYITLPKPWPRTPLSTRKNKSF